MKVLLALIGLCLCGLTARVAADVPTIASINPTVGPVGSTVVIDGSGFAPPFSVTFAGGVAAAGSFTSTEIMVTVPSGAQTGPITVTTTGGSAASPVFTVGSATTPVATLTTTVATASVSTGQNGEFTVTLSAAQANDVVIDYSLKGSAVNGTDYALLKGTTKVKAGKASKVIKIVPMGDLGGASKKNVKLTLETGSGYTVGTATAAKVKITP